jgi:hypothetical protein
MTAKRLTSEHRNKLRKKRTAIILGNLIIICTFIARDVLRESLKERLNNLNIAQVSYVSRYDVSTILMQTVDFTSGINRFIHRIERHATGLEASEEDKLNYEFEITNARVVTERVLLQNVETLLRGVGTFSKEYIDLKSTSDATTIAFSNLQDRKNQSVSEKTTELLKIRTVEGPLLEKILGVGLVSWENSKKHSYTLEKRYRYKNYAFFALFIIGVVVNLLGALSGVEIEQESL